MQMICAWPKIWTLSGRLSPMRTVQLMKKMSDASKNIFRVYHIRIIAPKKMVHATWNRQIPLEYGGTFTKLFMHVSSRNMFPTIRNLQIRVHVYHPRHCCGDMINFRLFCSDDWQSWPRDEKINNHHSWQWLLRNLSVSCRVNHFFLGLHNNGEGDKHAHGFADF
jgi:hypothetical protein